MILKPAPGTARESPLRAPRPDAPVSASGAEPTSNDGGSVAPADKGSAGTPASGSFAAAMAHAAQTTQPGSRPAPPVAPAPATVVVNAPAREPAGAAPATAQPALAPSGAPAAAAAPGAGRSAAAAGSTGPAGSAASTAVPEPAATKGSGPAHVVAHGGKPVAAARASVPGGPNSAAAAAKASAASASPEETAASPAGGSAKPIKPARAPAQGAAAPPSNVAPDAPNATTDAANAALVASALLAGNTFRPAALARADIGSSAEKAEPAGGLRADGARAGGPSTAASAPGNGADAADPASVIATGNGPRATAPHLGQVPDATDTDGGARAAGATGAVTGKDTVAPASSAAVRHSADGSPRTMNDAVSTVTGASPEDQGTAWFAQTPPFAAALGELAGALPWAGTGSATPAAGGLGGARTADLPPIVPVNATDAATAAALATLSAAGAGASAGTAAVAVHVATPVGDAGFGRELSQQLVMLTKTGAQSAQLSLNPEHLGPVSVSIQMNGLEASLSISAAHEATRAALREALPQLHALFQQGGLQLGGAQVGDGSERHAGRQDPADERRTSAFGAISSGVAAGSGAPVAGPAPGPARLVDTFA